MTQLLVMVCYLGLLLALGSVAGRYFRGTARDFFVASNTIGPFLLLMSIFGTTMTAFALVGTSGEAYRSGISVYAMVASWSGLIHAGIFFFVGIRLWAAGRKFGYLTQIQYIRGRYESDFLGLLLFPVLVALVVPYLLTGLLGAGAVVGALTRGALPELFAATGGAVPAWLTNLVISLVVLYYVFFGGLRGAAWANTLQTLVFILTSVAAFAIIAHQLGGVSAITQRVAELRPDLLVRQGQVSHLQFLSYCLIPVSVATFPHIFQHWLTARSAKDFRLTVVGHPICMLIVWVPCVLIGIWAAVALLPDGAPVVPPGSPPNSELAQMVEKLTGTFLGGLLGAGILAAIMSSLDSQFLCIGTMFTEDIANHYFGRDLLSDRQQVMLARIFVVLVVAVTYTLSLVEPRQVFAVGIWCFSGFSALSPIIFAAIYWKRVTSAGAIAAVLVTIVTWLALYRDSGYGADANYLFLGMMPVATIFGASTLALVIVSLLTRPPSQATIRKFFPEEQVSTAALSR